MLENIQGTPEARSRLCLCRASFLMTFATGGAPHAAPGRLSFLSPGNLPDTGIEPMSLVSPALAGGFFTTSATGKALLIPMLVLS